MGQFFHLIFSPLGSLGGQGASSASRIRTSQLGISHLFTLSLCVAMSGISVADEVDFRRDVQPILADKCFHCHGPDAQNQDSDLRVDSKENLLADLGGYFAVVPGDVENSELLARIQSHDADLQMPPLDSNRSLTKQQKQILADWIEQGAVYQKHWAFERIERPDVPDVHLPTGEILTNPIDAFIVRRLQEERLQLSKQATSETLLRRASLTLTGLLPSDDMQKRFLANPTDEAFQAAVDELMDSMAYAERQSLRWLDAARYADTDGYQNDKGRTNWPWRDWVTKAYHDNMPFDQFTIEQIAGDMLPEATASQKLASAFNRNHRQNAEGGALADEFFVENVIDRVETTSTVWLGLTMGCARCHDHKYDPLSQREFYQMFAYFNNIGERGIGPGLKANPTLVASSPLVKIPKQHRQAVDLAQQKVANAKKGLADRRETWIKTSSQEIPKQSDPWKIVSVRDATVEGKGQLVASENDLKFEGPTSGAISYVVTLPAVKHAVTAIQMTALPDDSFAKPRQLSASVNGNFVMTDFKVLAQEQEIPVNSVQATVEQNNYPVSNIIDDNKESGWAVLDDKKNSGPASMMAVLSKPVAAGTPIVLKLMFPNRFANHNAGLIRFHVSDQPVAELTFEGTENAIHKILRKPTDKRTKTDLELLVTHYDTVDEELNAARQALKAAQENLKKLQGPSATVMVMQEKNGDPKPAYLLDRGQYDAPVKDNVLPRAIPVALLDTQPSSTDSRQPSDRLELARWLVSRDNPLTARVTVNRIWQDHFGTGLVKTTEDFGVQGEVPSHPELLDWLAVEFMESGWDVKALHRKIVTSKTYGQSSKTNTQLQDLDPENRLFARGLRYRADGFVIRDIVLQSAGLLQTRAGGPSVKPRQPAGLWANLAAKKGTKYVPAKGADLYRKSMYTYWKRAVNPPRQTIFDAGGREVCNVRTRRTNTPLQALVLMNDPTMIEAAIMLAQSTVDQPTVDQPTVDQHSGDSASDAKLIRIMYRKAIARELSLEALEVLQKSLTFFRNHFDEHSEEGAKFLQTGSFQADNKIAAKDLAAWAAVAHLILNLDEMITIE